MDGRQDRRARAQDTPAARPGTRSRRAVNRDRDRRPDSRSPSTVGVVGWIVADHLVAMLGLYGATLVFAFLAGVFPLLSIELFLVGAAAWGVAADRLAVLIAIAAVGHQVAKTITYYAGAGALELPRGKLRDQIAAARQRIDRWNRRPRLVMLAGAAVGLPPLYLLGFLARPVFRMQLATFTGISMAGRLARYTTLVAIARLL
jgi:membrane protein YqaA with SNARE-associated domain